MKNLLLSIIICFSGGLLLAQPVLNSQMNLDIGDTYRNDMYDGVTNIDPGGGGPAQSWDFSEISGGTFIEGVPNVCVNPATTPFADSATLSSANIAIVNAETPDQGLFQYLSCDNSCMDLVGLGFLEMGNNSFNHYADAHTVMDYPMSYGDGFEDTFDFYTFMIDLGFYFMRDSAQVVVEADAYGSLETPIGTFPNTLRIKRTITDHVFMCYEPGGQWNYSGSFTSIEYMWYAPGIKMPLLNITENEGMAERTVIYLADYNFQTAIAESAEKQIKVYPNPATEKLIIIADQPIQEVNISAVLGGDIHKSRMSHQQFQLILDIHSYPNGMYLLDVLFDDGSSICKTIVKQ